MRKVLLCLSVLTFIPVFGQKEVPLISKPEKVTVFFEGAQIEQGGEVNLTKGRQFVVFKKLTDEMDNQSVRVKGKGDVTILSVKSRKNFEDKVISNSELESLNKQKKDLEDKQNALFDEDKVYAFDQTVLNANYSLKGEQEGVKVSELKEASLFFHAKMEEIQTQRRRIKGELEKLVLQLDEVRQEIYARRSKPIINYSEVVVEVEANSTGKADFELSYISPAASWSPYYDMRAEGINKPIKLEAKAKVHQNTGIDWDNVDLVLSTNNPYENAQEPTLNPWYLYYNNYVYDQPAPQRRAITKDYSGQTIQGEVIDVKTGEALPFCSITIPGTTSTAVTDFDGKFKINVPQGGSTITASFVGYGGVYSNITGPYMKIFMSSDNLQMNDVTVSSNMETLTQKDNQGIAMRGGRSSDNETYYYIDGIKVRGATNLPQAALEETQLYTGGTPASYRDEYERSSSDGYSSNAEYSGKNYKSTSYDKKAADQLNVTSVRKDMRVEYTIATKFSVPADGSEYGVNITTYDLKANFEYHAVPKIDPSPFLVAGVYGWEQYNLLSATTNIYFDGTYIGATNLDASSTKDTINFSLGKENGIVITRKKVDAMSTAKLVGNRKKLEAGYEIEIRNNTAAVIPLLIKDQFPISRDADIKVKQGEYTNATLDAKTGILLWRLLLNQGDKTTLKFNYDVDYDKVPYLKVE